MKLVFAGTPEFAAAALDALHRAGHDIALVLTQPDRPAGRGLKAAASAVKQRAQALGLRIEQPRTLRDAHAVELIASETPDAMVVAAYGLILPAAVLDAPRLYCLNIHASLLPRWRGAAPIQRAILAGDRETGISIMQMDEGLDTGPVMLAEATAIGADDTAQTLHDRLKEMGARLIVEALSAPRPVQPQDASLATYAPKIDKREALIDWREPAQTIARKVRAFNPVPGATTLRGGAAIKIWSARVTEGLQAEPGTVCRADGAGIVVACGEGALCVTELQRAGGRRVQAGAFLAGSRLEPGEAFGE